MSENFGDNKFQSKLQIKARLLSSIANLQTNSRDRLFVNNEIAELSLIEDKKAVLDILQKEFLKENSESRDYTICFLLQELVEQSESEKSFFEMLANPKVSDKLKTKAISFLRELGKHINYDEYVSYFENPDELIDSDTEKLLENAKINPEAQIDFLDFMAALPDKEKEILLDSLVADYDGDNLANILNPVILSNPYSSISQLAIKAIGESKSALAFPVLTWLKENIDDLQVSSVVQKSLSLLKLSGVKEDTTKDYYKKILANSPVYHCTVSYPDGHGNIGLIFSRRNNLDFVQMFAVVLNDIDGIVDCFGFNQITDKEFERIICKFHQDNNVVGVDAEFCKYLLENAEKITRLKFKEVSYEYIAWKSIIADIDYIDYNLKNEEEPALINEFMLKQLDEQGYFDKWFFTQNDNNTFCNVVESLTQDKIDSPKDFELTLSNNLSNIFDNFVLKMISYRLVLSGYLAKLEGKDIISKSLYSLVESGDIKDLFLLTYLKRSLYQYFLAQKDRYDSLKNATSIFARKANQELNAIDIKYVQSCIDNIEKCWAKNE